MFDMITESTITQLQPCLVLFSGKLRTTPRTLSPRPSDRALLTRRKIFHHIFCSISISPVYWPSSAGFFLYRCQFPQITTEGLVDSHTHGADLRSVYASRLGLSSSIDYSTVGIRTCYYSLRFGTALNTTLSHCPGVTNNVITSQVAGALVSGLFPSVASSGTPVQALIESDNYDALEPAYSCPNAVSILSNYESTNASWTGHLTAAAGLYKKLDAVSGIASNDTGGWHTSFDQYVSLLPLPVCLRFSRLTTSNDVLHTSYYDNMSAKQCHSKSLPCSVNDTSLCVTQDEADTVYRLGNWEWSFYYRDAQNSTLYSALHYGAWILELKAHLEAKIAGGQVCSHYLTFTYKTELITSIYTICLL